MGQAPTVLSAGKDYEHIMALNLDPGEGQGSGVIRCIESREGSVDEPGFIDRSHLRLVYMDNHASATIGEPLTMDKQQEVLASLPEHGKWTFLGFEDPTLWRSPEGTLHLYYTIPFHNTQTGETNMYLGHSDGSGLHSLTMRAPVLASPDDHSGAKEVAFMPPAADGSRYNLVESSHYDGYESYSVIRRVKQSSSDAWSYSGVALHPSERGADWCAGHVSPGPVLPKDFAPLGRERRVCLLNGREANEFTEDGPRFGTFSIGLMVYNVETGAVERISDEPIIDEPEAETITFGSEFTQTAPDQGTVYAHIDDSHVRAYDLSAEDVSAGLKEKCLLA